MNAIEARKHYLEREIDEKMLAYERALTSHNKEKYIREADRCAKELKGLHTFLNAHDL